MSDSKHPSAVSVDQQNIYRAGEAAKNGNYAEALSLIQNAKTRHPRNIYIIALEKQIEKLVLIGETALSESRQKEITNSFPHLTDRAIENIGRAERTSQTLPAAPERGHEERSHNQKKETAIEKLKEKYFRQSDEYITQGRYENALAEVRRIQLLDPADRAAIEYEEKLAQLVASSEAVPPREPTLGPVAEQTTSRDRIYVQGLAPGQSEFPPPFLDLTRPERYGPHKTKRPPVIFILAVVLIFGGAGLGYYLASRSGARNAQTAEAGAEALSTLGGQPNQLFDGISTEDLKQPKSGSSPNIPGPTNSNSQRETVPVPSALLESTPELDLSTLKRPGIPVVSQTESGDTRTEMIAADKAEKGDTELTRGSLLKPVQPHANTSIAAPAEIARKVSSPGEADSGTVPESSADAGKAPLITKIAKPQYPDSAFQIGLSGQVILRVQVDPAGKPLQAKIFKSSHPIFEQPAIDAAMKSQYSPGLSSTGPVIAWITVPFVFRKSNP